MRRRAEKTIMLFRSSCLLCTKSTLWCWLILMFSKMWCSWEFRICRGTCNQCEIPKICISPWLFKFVVLAWNWYAIFFWTEPNRTEFVGTDLNLFELDWSEWKLLEETNWTEVNENCLRKLIELNWISLV